MRRETIERFVRRLVLFDGFITLLTDDLSGYDDITYIAGEGERKRQYPHLRLVTALPATLILAIAGSIAIFTWLVAAASVLVIGKYSSVLYRFHANVVGLGAEVLAYLGSLTDAYPRSRFFGSRQ